MRVAILLFVLSIFLSHPASAMSDAQCRAVILEIRQVQDFFSALEKIRARSSELNDEERAQAIIALFTRFEFPQLSNGDKKAFFALEDFLFPSNTLSKVDPSTRLKIETDPRVTYFRRGRVNPLDRPEYVRSYVKKIESLGAIADPNGSFLKRTTDLDSILAYRFYEYLYQKLKVRTFKMARIMKDILDLIGHPKLDQISFGLWMAGIEWFRLNAPPDQLLQHLQEIYEVRRILKSDRYVRLVSLSLEFQFLKDKKLESSFDIRYWGPPRGAPGKVVEVKSIQEFSSIRDFTPAIRSAIDKIKRARAAPETDEYNPLKDPLPHKELTIQMDWTWHRKEIRHGQTVRTIFPDGAVSIDVERDGERIHEADSHIFLNFARHLSELPDISELSFLTLTDRDGKAIVELIPFYQFERILNALGRPWNPSRGQAEPWIIQSPQHHGKFIIPFKDGTNSGLVDY